MALFSTQGKGGCPLNALTLVILATALFSVNASQAAFDTYIAANCPNWEASVNLGEKCCCFEKTGDAVTCVQAKAAFFNVQQKCKYTGVYDAAIASATGDCAPSSKLYKQIYTSTI